MRLSRGVEEDSLIFMVMNISPETSAHVNALIAKNGARATAVMLVDKFLQKEIGLGSSDLSDTSTFAGGLDEIEALLTQNDFGEAFEVARDTAKAMIEEEGLTQDDEEVDWLDRLVQRGGHLDESELRRAVRGIVKDELGK